MCTQQSFTLCAVCTVSSGLSADTDYRFIFCVGPMNGLNRTQRYFPGDNPDL